MYLRLDQVEKCLATYMWMNGTGENMRGKNRTLPSVPRGLDELPTWNFNGSSTGQSDGSDSDAYIRPVSVFKDPFLAGDNVLVMCDTLNSDGLPTATNHRAASQKAMTLAKKSQNDQLYGKCCAFYVINNVICLCVLLECM